MGTTYILILIWFGVIGLNAAYSLGKDSYHFQEETVRIETSTIEFLTIQKYIAINEEYLNLNKETIIKTLRKEFIFKTQDSLPIKIERQEPDERQYTNHPMITYRLSLKVGLNKEENN